MKKKPTITDKKKSVLIPRGLRAPGDFFEKSEEINQ